MSASMSTCLARCRWRGFLQISWMLLVWNSKSSVLMTSLSSRWVCRLIRCFLFIIIRRKPPSPVQVSAEGGFKYALSIADTRQEAPWDILCQPVWTHQLHHRYPLWLHRWKCSDGGGGRIHLIAYTACSLKWNEAICMLFVVVSKQQKVGYFISTSWLHLCPTLLPIMCGSSVAFFAVHPGQFKKVLDAQEMQTRAAISSSPLRVHTWKAGAFLVGGSWWRVPPPAGMKWAWRHYKHSASAPAGRGGRQRLREGITAGKKGVREGGETAVIGCNNLK